MAALLPGAKAPEFDLPLTSGSRFSLAEALKARPVVLAFFKISCPVCQFAFPLYSRASQRAKGVTFIGVSQDDLAATKDFMRRFEVSFPVALDDQKGYPVSSAYGLTNVPTVFLISQDGTVEVSSVGWAREELEDIYRRTSSSGAGTPLFQPQEQIPEFKAG